jgi:hypothetical protein
METHVIISSMTALMRQRWTRSCAADWYAGQHKKPRVVSTPATKLLTFREHL